MKAHIERNVLGQNVKIYLYDDGPQGRVFYWPVEVAGEWWTWFTQHETPGTLAEIRPAFNVSLQMWEAFTKAMLETEHVRVDAIDIVAKTLEREQDRVDKLITAVIGRMM